MVVKYSLQKDNKTIKCVDFNGFSDQLAYISSFIKEDKFGTCTEVSKKDDFYGFHSLNETIQGMDYGFEKNTEYFLDTIEEVKTNEDAANGIFMDIEGFAYDMGSFVSGIPEYYINSTLPTPTPYVKILLDIVFPASFTSKQILNRGIAVTVLIENLLARGFIIDLYAFEFNRQDDMNVMYTNKIDTCNLSISNIAFMSSPEYFRKIGFITVDAIRNKCSSWGRGNSCLLPFMVDKIKKQNLFYIGGGYTDTGLYNNLDTPNKAINYILDKFNTFAKENKIYVNFKTIDTKNNK